VAAYFETLRDQTEVEDRKPEAPDNDGGRMLPYEYGAAKTDSPKDETRRYDQEEEGDG